MYFCHCWAVRADRLLSLVLLLQHRGRMSASALAGELEVSARTVLRDVEALSAAGIPIYAERGRNGGFALLAGFSTDLTGLTHDEALALLVAGSRGESLGMAPALASAMRKVVAALPQQQRATATRDAGRVLVRQEGWLREPDERDAAADERLAVVRRAVFAGHRLRIRYAAAGDEPRWRTVDPLGLVNSRGRWYLLATRDGEERNYRLSRMVEARELAEPADRPSGVDLERVWQERRERFSAESVFAVRVRVLVSSRPALVRTARGVTAERPDRDGWLQVDLDFADPAHAEAILWSLAPDAEVLEPSSLRAALAARAVATAARHAATGTGAGTPQGRHPG